MEKRYDGRGNHRDQSSASALYDLSRSTIAPDDFRTPKSQPAEVSPRERPSPPFTGSGAGSGSLVWHWPVSEQPVREFGKGNKGLDFDLRAGTIIGAAADGEVVYAGAGLGGYESLTIIRHINGFLSAYSLNGPIQHKEGDQVGRGDRVAEIVASGRLTRFHFEIRKDGDPVSPRVLLD